MATKDHYREAHRRTHKLLAAYLALLAWKQGIDCAVIPRKELLEFLDLDIMRDARLNDVGNDVKYLFPYIKETEESDHKYSTLYLSRVPFPDLMWLCGNITDEKRVKVAADLGLNAAIVNIPNEAEIKRILSQVMHGLADF